MWCVDMGPLLVWQLCSWDTPSSVPALTRLLRAGEWGLPVGPNTQRWGGLRTDIAFRYERKGLALLERTNDETIVRAFACQLHFDFRLGQWWNVY